MVLSNRFWKSEWTFICGISTIWTYNFKIHWILKIKSSMGICNTIWCSCTFFKNISWCT